jgi:hypothetical protein
MEKGTQKHDNKKARFIDTIAKPYKCNTSK